MGFTFKKNRPTGRYRSFDSESIDIKLNGKKVGSIGFHRIGYSRNGSYKIMFSVIKDGVNFTDSNPNSDWKWIILKYPFNDINEARQFVIQNQSKYLKLPFKFLD